MSTLIKVVTGPSGSGKCLSLDTKILTPNGWVLNRDLQLGDYVISQDGKATKVLEIFDNELVDMYNVEFSDDSSVECCNKHLWSVWSPNSLFKNKELVTLTLEDMLDKINNSPKDLNYYSIPLVQPVEFNTKSISIDPYILGGLIAKNKLKASKIPLDLREPLEQLNLLDCDNKTKFIPKEYLFNSIEIRKELLAGILDASAVTANRYDTKTLRITNEVITSSYQFSKDLVELIRGLGVRVKLNSYNKRYEIYFSAISFNPYKDLIRRDVFAQSKSKLKPVKRIKSATYIGKKPGRCIVVDNPSHLYVVKDYVVTHNSYKLKEEMTTNRLKLTASTGIASVNLSESACTIHSLLGAIDSNTLLKSYISGKLIKRLNNIFEDYNGIAIDEFGMLPRDYLDSLIKILDLYGDRINRNLELYLTGDIAQLPPVEFCGYIQ